LDAAIQSKSLPGSESLANLIVIGSVVGFLLVVLVGIAAAVIPHGGARDRLNRLLFKAGIISELPPPSSNSNRSSAATAAMAMGFRPLSELEEQSNLGERSTLISSLVGDATSWEIEWSAVQVVRKVGFGSSGQVFEGRLGGGEYGYKVALKQLFSVLVIEDLGEFRHEARLLARLHHPALVRFYGITVSPERELFLVLEFCPRSLAEILNDEEFDLSDELYTEFALQMAKGVAFLHHQKVIHRDLKPQNVLYSEQGDLKICDFGLSRIVPSGSEGAPARPPVFGAVFGQSSSPPSPSSSSRGPRR